MEYTQEYVGDPSQHGVVRAEDLPLEVNHSLLAQLEIDALRGEVQSLRCNLTLRESHVILQRERDEAIKKYDNSIKIIRLLVKEIEHPAYGVDDVIDRMFLIENAKKLTE